MENNIEIEEKKTLDDLPRCPICNDTGWYFSPEPNDYDGSGEELKVYCTCQVHDDYDNQED